MTTGWHGAARGAVALALAAAVLLSVAGTATGQPQTPPKSGGVDFWQPDWMVRELWGPGHMPKGMMTRILRHMTYMHYGVAKEYEGARSTITPGPEAAAVGARLFAQNCAACHGRDGLGDGDAGNALSPSPALLAYMIRRPISVDEYLLWTISEGGKAFESAMPAFKDKLKREEIWQVIAYMRAGFPAVNAEGKPMPPFKGK